jgi:hypothetical protein
MPVFVVSHEHLVVRKAVPVNRFVSYLTSNNAFLSSMYHPINSSTTMGGITTHNSYSVNLLIKKNTRKAYEILKELKQISRSLRDMGLIKVGKIR